MAAATSCAAMVRLVRRRFSSAPGQPPIEPATGPIEPAASSSASASSPAKRDKPEALETAYANVSGAVALAMQHRDPDDINRAKQLASNFVELYSDAYRRLPPERQQAVEQVFGARVRELRADLLTLYKTRTFDE